MIERLWRDSAQLQRLLERTFSEIQHTRMVGLPVMNPELSVQALNFLYYQQYWVGMLITPWFMNLLILPQVADDWQQYRRGEKFSTHFPAGDFEFVVADEPTLGPYASCSLYSPMFQFDRQDVAAATAQAAWRALFLDQETLGAAGNTRPNVISRRELLRGRIGTRRSES